MTATEGACTLRPATPGDATAVTQVYLRARRSATMPPSVHDDEAVAAWIEGEIADKESWVAEVDGAVVGFAVFTTTWLDDLYVDPAHQREGIGAALLDLVRARRPDGWSLWVFAQNTPARAFYRGQGLIELEQRDGSANEEQSPDVRMAWPGRDPLAFLRGQIDEVDDDLALVIARRSALTWAVQDLKAAAGSGAGARGRDAEREAAIVDRIAGLVPMLAREQLARVLHVVITESLAAWEAGRDA